MRSRHSLVLAALFVSLAVPASAQFASDTFTDTAGDNIVSAHTPDLGGPWVLHSGSTGNMLVTDANRARCNDGGVRCAHYLTATPPSADYDVQVTLHYITNNASHIGPAGRMSTSAHTNYHCNAQVNSAQWILEKVVAGSFTSLGTAAQTFSATDYVVKLVMRGSSISCYVDGVLKIGPVTDTDITAAGKAGFDQFGSSANNTGVHIDTFSATAATVRSGTLMGVLP